MTFLIDSIQIENGCSLIKYHNEYGVLQSYECSESIAEYATQFTHIRFQDMGNTVVFTCDGPWY